ncbi:MAG: AI-2E family transporter [Actinomycetota bacterium]|nr:AI-2E family transporter [Actinomycetota bacterium]
MDDDRGRLLSAPYVLRAARGGIVAWSLIGIVVLGFIFLRFVVYPIRIIFPPLVVAMIAVYLLNPIVSTMERRGVPRLVGTLVTYLIGLGIFSTAMAFVAPIVAEQVRTFTREAPDLIERVANGLRDIAQRAGIDVQQGTDGTDVVGVLGRLLDVGRDIVDVALIFILGPILAFYFLVDLPKIRRGIRAMIPARRRAEVESVMQRIGRAIGGFFRGQLLVSLFVGAAGALVLYVVGLPFWAVVGLITGLFNLIPLIGPFIGGGVAVLIAFTTQAPAGGLLHLEPGWPLALGSAVGLLIVQQIDNHILSPNIVARTVNLHPVTVMLGLLAGGTLLGLWGMLLAVPVLATVKILLLHTWDTRGTWPPPSEEGAAAVSVSRPGLPTDSPVERLERAKEPKRPTERRGSWWTNALRAMLGPRRSRPGQPRRPEDEAREPERQHEPERTPGG